MSINNFSKVNLEYYRIQLLEDIEKIFYNSEDKNIKQRNLEIFNLRMKVLRINDNFKTLKNISDNYKMTKEGIRKIIEDVYQKLFREKYKEFFQTLYHILENENNIIKAQTIFPEISQLEIDRKVILHNILEYSGISYLIEEDLMYKKFGSHSYKKLIKNLSGFLDTNIPSIGNLKLLEESLKIFMHENNYKSLSTLLDICYTHCIHKFCDRYILKNTPKITKMLYVLEKYFVNGISIKDDKNEFLETSNRLFPYDFLPDSDVNSLLTYLVHNKNVTFLKNTKIYIHKNNT